MEHRMREMEEQLAHLQKQLDDMSDVVAQQGAELSLATRRVELLMQREAERQADEGGSVAFGDQRPPHY